MAMFGRALSVLGVMCVTVLHPGATAGAQTCDPLDQGGSPNSCANFPPASWPLAQGDFTSASDPGWMFFTGRAGTAHCGIGPDGTVGCDHVPPRNADGTPVQPGQPGPPGSYSCGGRDCPLPPAGANQLVAAPQQAGHWAVSPAPTFTRPVAELPAGYRLVNGDAWCYQGYQGTITCTSGANGFVIDSYGGAILAP